MAVKKATTTEDLTKSAESPAPTLSERVAQVEEFSDPAMVAEGEAAKTVKVKSPFGAVTEVPEGIVDALLASGYTKSSK